MAHTDTLKTIMKLTFCVFILNLLYKCIFCIDEDSDLKTPQLIEKYGYPVEVHALTTQDGFKLTLHRIPYGKSLPLSGIPVLVTHSLMCSSASWVDNLNDSLGFILADEKFDVWLGNFRGNSYTSHTKYTMQDHEFWDFSWNEMVEYDLPAFINYIQTVTGYSKILYIGQSLGSLVGFSLFSSKLEYNDKVAGFVAMAPVASVSYQASIVLTFFQQNAQLTEDVLNILNLDRFFYLPPTLLKIGFVLCSAGDFCESYIHLFGGYNPTVRNSTRFLVYASHCSEGTSKKNLRLFNQQLQYNIPRRFDYGKSSNLKRYGSENPPLYNLSAITVPIALFSALNDPIASPLDVQILKRQLRSVVAHEVIPDPLFSHVDFIWLHPAKDLLYGKVVKHLRSMWNAAL